MALTSVPLPFGMRDIKLTPITDAGTLGTAVDLPYGRTLSWSEAEDYEELRGDDHVVTSHGSGPSCEWDLESGGISFEALKVLNGGTISETGVTPNQSKTYSKKVTDIRPFFKAEGQSISDSGGDFHAILYRCRTTGDVEGEMSDGSFWLTSCSGTAFASQEAGNEDLLYDFVQNETATAIGA